MENTTSVQPGASEIVVEADLVIHDAHPLNEPVRLCQIESHEGETWFSTSPLDRRFSWSNPAVYTAEIGDFWVRELDPGELTAYTFLGTYLALPDGDEIRFVRFDLGGVA